MLSAPSKKQKLPACCEQGLSIERFTFNFEQLQGIILSEKEKKKKNRSLEISELFTQLPGRAPHCNQPLSSTVWRSRVASPPRVVSHLLRVDKILTSLKQKNRQPGKEVTAAGRAPRYHYCPVLTGKVLAASSNRSGLHPLLF